MARNKPVPALAAAVVVLALLVLDLHPVLHHAPLILLVLAGAVQIDRELAHAYAALGRYPSAPSMNFLTVIVVVHLAYFAQPIASSLLELVGTVAVAMYTLVVVAAIGSDLKLHGRRQAIGFMVLSFVIPWVVGGGLSATFYVQSAFGGAPSAQGSHLVALLVAAAWTGMGLGRRLLAAGQPASVVATVRGLLPLVVVAAGAFALGLAGELGTTRLIAVAAATGLGTASGCAVIDSFAGRCRIESFRWRLPSQIDFLQPIYNNLFAGGLTDYAGPLVCVMPLALLALRGLGQ